jgi:hypothetical protein
LKVEVHLLIFFEEKIENEKILDVRNVDYGGGLPPVE